MIGGWSSQAETSYAPIRSHTFIAVSYSYNLLRLTQWVPRLFPPGIQQVPKTNKNTCLVASIDVLIRSATSMLENQIEPNKYIR